MTFTDDTNSRLADLRRRLDSAISIHLKREEDTREARNYFLRSVGCTSALRTSAYQQAEIRNETIASKLRVQLWPALRFAFDRLASEGEVIQRITLMESEMHGFRLPILLDTSNGQYVLKWGESTPWRILEITYSEVQDFDSYEGIFQSIKIEGDWILRKWVPHAKTGDVESQQWGLGFVCALAVSLNLFDMHHENYVITKNGAIPIDVECMFYALDSLSYSMNLDFVGVFNSVIGFSALNGATRFDEYCIPTIRNGRFEITEVKKRESHTFRNNQGASARLGTNFEKFEDGFRKGVWLCQRQRDRILDVLVKYDFLSRKIFRPTRFYRVLLNEIEMFGYELSREVFSGRLRSAGRIPTFPYINLGHHEWQQLNSGNIPIFHVSVNSGEVFSNFEEGVGWWHTPPLKQWEKKMDLLNECRIKALLNEIRRRANKYESNIYG